jgi:hypothetical protein
MGLSAHAGVRADVIRAVALLADAPYESVVVLKHRGTPAADQLTELLASRAALPLSLPSLVDLRRYSKVATPNR